jgi:hypothetical protein
MLVDRQVILGVISGGDLGDVAGADFGLVNLVKVTAGFADDLVATWRYHEVRTLDAVGQPPVSVVGEVVFDTGTIADGALTQSDGATGTPAGSQGAAADGSFTASVSGVGTPWQLTGQVLASTDLIAGPRTWAPGPLRSGARERVDPTPRWRRRISPARGESTRWPSTVRRAISGRSCGARSWSTPAARPREWLDRRRSRRTLRTLNSGLLAVDATTGRVREASPRRRGRRSPSTAP